MSESKPSSMEILREYIAANFPPPEEHRHVHWAVDPSNPVPIPNRIEDES